MRSVRIFFEKNNSMKFISHLDMNRFMIRMIRVSKIPVWYSEGFNPHPYITFALPLSLGFESSYEIMDIRLDDDAFSNEDVFSALAKVMPQDIKMINACDPVMKAGDITSAEFCVDFDDVSDNIIQKITEFLNMDEIITEKKTKKGKINVIDISSMIYSFRFENAKLYLNLAAGGNNNLNPKLLLEAFEKMYNCNLSYKIRKTMVFGKDKKQFI